MGITAGVFMAAGGIAGASAAKTQAEVQRQQARFNAEAAEAQASEVEKRGEKEAKLQEKKTRALIGKQKAAQAAQGIDVGAGSALDIQSETANFGMQDAATIRQNAYREAFGYRSQAINIRSQGEFDYIAGKSEAKRTLLTGLVSGGASAYGSAQKGESAWSKKKDGP